MPVGIAEEDTIIKRFAPFVDIVTWFAAGAYPTCPKEIEIPVEIYPLACRATVWVAVLCDIVVMLLALFGSLPSW